MTGHNDTNHELDMDQLHGLSGGDGTYHVPGTKAGGTVSAGPGSTGPVSGGLFGAGFGVGIMICLLI